MFKFKLNNIPAGKYAVNLEFEYEVREFYNAIFRYADIGRSLDSCLEQWRSIRVFNDSACFALYNGVLTGIATKGACKASYYKIIEVEEWFEDTGDDALENDLFDVLGIEL